MTVSILSGILSVVFLLFSVFHFYWFFGGSYGLTKVIPTKGNKANTVKIPKLATLLVALVLLSFSLLYSIKSGILFFDILGWLSDFCYWFIPIVFILRAIGEFNYTGFFKRIKNTEFARADSTFFSPLCLLIGIIGIIIQLMA